MAEIAAARIVFRIPVMGQLDHRDLHLGRALALRNAATAFDVGRGRQENQGETAGLAVIPANFRQTEAVAKELKRGVNVGDTHHRVQKFDAHQAPPLRSRMTCLRLGGISA